MKAVLYKNLVEIGRESSATTMMLFKILIPALLLVKMLEYFGATEILASLTEPLMQPLGLPDIAGLIWATAMLVNIYTAIAVFFSIAATIDWTQAQVTCLGIMLLTTHNLVVELRIAQKAGCRLLTQLLLRVGCAILFCYILNTLFSVTGWLQDDANIIWQPGSTDNSLLQWLIDQLKSLTMIAVMIFLLITLLRIFKSIGIEKLLTIILRPLFRFMGLAKEATNITVVGFTLGLAYGGSLLIREAQSGKIDTRDVFASISLLGICHSLIEDTILVLVIGADIYTVLILRLLFSVVVIAIIMRAVRTLPTSQVEKYLARPTTPG